MLIYLNAINKYCGQRHSTRLSKSSFDRFNASCFTTDDHWIITGNVNIATRKEIIEATSLVNNNSLSFFKNSIKVVNFRKTPQLTLGPCRKAPRMRDWDLVINGNHRVTPDISD